MKNTKQTGFIFPLLVVIFVLTFGSIYTYQINHKSTESKLPDTNIISKNNTSKTFKYDEVLKAKIGRAGGTITNMDETISVKFPATKEVREFTLSFKENDLVVDSSSSWAPVVINISPDVDLSNYDPIEIKVKFDDRYSLPVPYLIGEAKSDRDNGLRAVNIGNLDNVNHYFTIYTFHGGSYSWTYAQ